MAPSVRASSKVGSGTSAGVNMNSNPGPLTVPDVPGLAAGDGYLLFVFCQNLSGNATFPTTWFPASEPTFQQIVATSSSGTRLLGVFAGIVADPAHYSGLKPRASTSTSTRVVIHAVAIQPSAGHHLTMEDIIGSAATYSATADNNEAWPGAAGELQVSMAASNKASSATATTHTAAGGGTIIDQLTALAAALPASDTCVSVVAGGTGVTANVNQANWMTASVGITEVEDEEPPEPEGFPVKLSDGADGTVDATAWLADGAGGVVPVAGILSLAARSYTITEMEADLAASRDVFWAHRGGSQDAWGEMTLRGYTNCIWHGAKALEVSVNRSSDGVWIMSHDADTARVTATSYTIASTAAATMLGIAVDTPTTGGVIGRLEDVLAAYKDFVILIDNKPQSNRTELFDLVKSFYPDGSWADHIIWKIDGAQSAARFQEAQAAGFKTAGYWYNSSSGWGDGGISGKVAYCDYPGLNYDADQSYWDSLAGFAGSKPLWGHVLGSLGNKATAEGKGATIFQCAAVTAIVPAVNALP